MVPATLQQLLFCPHKSITWRVIDMFYRVTDLFWFRRVINGHKLFKVVHVVPKAQ